MATKLPLPLSSILPVPWPYRETRADRGGGGREGFVTPWFISPGRPIFRPRKIKCFFAARFYRNRFHRVWYASRASSSSSSASRGLICFRKLSTVNKGWGGCKNPGRFFPWKNIFGPVSSVDGPRFERWLVTEEKSLRGEGVWVLACLLAGFDWAVFFPDLLFEEIRFEAVFVFCLLFHSVASSSRFKNRLTNHLI